MPNFNPNVLGFSAAVRCRVVDADGELILIEECTIYLWRFVLNVVKIFMGSTSDTKHHVGGSWEQLCGLTWPPSFSPSSPKGKKKTHLKKWSGMNMTKRKVAVYHIIFTCICHNITGLSFFSSNSKALWGLHLPVLKFQNDYKLRQISKRPAWVKMVTWELKWTEPRKQDFLRKRFWLKCT